ncbi:MAG TPA: molybdopterin-dependent oxidoreductase [Streptosporangiaceae bacterium]|jgi:DMSO/TMAO reductase YedYZ molybdopterin-dependent catalytic subunit|nr:molybdopterin-dependent oxidoreductase [Streptosporangiaceae bacterium]
MDGNHLADRHLNNEAVYDAMRLDQWLTGHARGAGVTRRGMLKMLTGAGLSAAALPALTGGTARAAVTQRAGSQASTATSPIVKPLSPDEFYVYGSNAEMRWEVMRGQGYTVPNANFFVRDHTSTPLIDASTWTLDVYGTGLAGSPTASNPVQFSYQDLLDLPSQMVVSFVECAGNGRSFFTTQQHQTVPGTPWLLGAIGVAAWRGVPLSIILDRAGITHQAVDVMPSGLDPHYVAGGVDYGPVRRPIPVSKAFDDVILAYEMNGVPLLPDSGYPVRFIVPSWAGISNIKWVGAIEVSDTPLFSYWNTQAYLLFGPTYPPGGQLITTQVVKSAFELEWNAQLPANQHYLLTGRSWSGNGHIAYTEISTDGGQTWHLATPRDVGFPAAWQLWEFPWYTPAAGSYTLQARATDVTGATQPVTVPYNTGGYLFGGIVDHPITTA